MTMQLSENERGRVAEKVMEWGNLVFAGLVVGQLVSGTPIDIFIASVGSLLIVGAYLFAVRLMKGGGRE